MNNLNFFENRIKTIKAHFQHEFTGYQNRGQIAKDSDVNEASTYGPLGVAHAKELSQTLDQLKSCLPDSFHVIDIGCGYALSRAVLKDSSFEVKSYHGFDANESMLWFAQQIDGDGKFVNSLDQIPIFHDHVLVIINHVFGQESVAQSDLIAWVDKLVANCKTGFTLLSIEICGFPPATRNFSYFRKQLSFKKVRIQNELEYLIKGQHKSEKVIRQWSVHPAS
jgi:hypothetical protein